MDTVIQVVLTGKLAPLGRRGVASGIAKQPRRQSVAVTLTGLFDDEQGDRKHHGGPEKAIHHYAIDHYPTWRAEIPVAAPCLAQAGAFGENISTTGLTEADVCVGDIYRLGTATVQVSQARQPCWRLNERFGLPTMARRVQESGRTGWYYRVLEVGQVAAGDTLELLERPAAEWPLERILHVLYRETPGTDSLRELARLTPLTESWRSLAQRRLDRGEVESWSRRLETPASGKPS